MHRVLGHAHADLREARRRRRHHAVGAGRRVVRGADQGGSAVSTPQRRRRWQRKAVERAPSRPVPEVPDGPDRPFGILDPIDPKNEPGAQVSTSPPRDVLSASPHTEKPARQNGKRRPGIVFTRVSWSEAIRGLPDDESRSYVSGRLREAGFPRTRLGTPGRPEKSWPTLSLGLRTGGKGHAPRWPRSGGERPSRT